MPIEIDKIRPESMYSVYEASQLLDVSAQSIRLYLNEGTLKGRKNRNKRWKISGAELLRYLGVNEK